MATAGRAAGRVADQPRREVDGDDHECRRMGGEHPSRVRMVRWNGCISLERRRCASPPGPARKRACPASGRRAQDFPALLPDQRECRLLMTAGAVARLRAMPESAAPVWLSLLEAGAQARASAAARTRCRKRAICFGTALSIL
jgi:hypothetical protein